MKVPPIVIGVPLSLGRLEAMTELYGLLSTNAMKRKGTFFIEGRGFSYVSHWLKGHLIKRKPRERDQ